MKPIVAVVGRANVGKSTLVNRIAKERKAITSKTSGVTRDRNYLATCWRDKEFLLVDTGGIDLFSKDTGLGQAVSKQALLAVGEADVIVFLTDGREGVLAGDIDVANVLRKTNKPVLVAVNKVDDPSKEPEADFYRLGLGKPRAISSLHGLGIGELLDEIVSFLPAVKEEKIEALKVTIVGRPNVGKSSLLNKLLGEERVIVSERAGTTKDAVDTFFNYGQKKYCFVDTAGLKRKSKIADEIDYYGYVRTLKALEEAEIALIVLDAAEGITKEDLKIAGLAQERGCASVVLLNKWDLVNESEKKVDLPLEVEEKFWFLGSPFVLKTSATYGLGINKIFSLLKETEKEYRKRISTAKLNSFVGQFLLEGKETFKRGKKLKVLYTTQVQVAPPVFTFFVNHPEIATPSFRRYLENKLRQDFCFIGCPIRIKFKKK